jgi:hypothetical protein
MPDPKHRDDERRHRPDRIVQPGDEIDDACDRAETKPMHRQDDDAAHQGDTPP